MDDVRKLIPSHKKDFERANAAIEAGYPAVAPILGDLIEWFRDYNWPIARVLTQFLTSLGKPLVPHIWHVLRTDDGAWKYWVISLLLPSLDEADAAQFRSELERLCFTPSQDEKEWELDQQAREVLEHFRWI